MSRGDTGVSRAAVQVPEGTFSAAVRPREVTEQFTSLGHSEPMKQALKILVT